MRTHTQGFKDQIKKKGREIYPFFSLSTNPIFHKEYGVNFFIKRKVLEKQSRNADKTGYSTCVLHTF